MGNFTTMVEIGRHNLGGSPLSPDMLSDGTLLYRTSGTAIRKCVYDVSDASLATLTTVSSPLMAITIGAVGTTSGGDSYYYVSELKKLTSPFSSVYYVNEINVSTGVVQTKTISGPDLNMHCVPRQQDGKMQILRSNGVINIGSPYGNVPHIRCYSEQSPFTGDTSYDSYPQWFQYPAPSYEATSQYGRNILNKYPTSEGDGPWIRLCGRYTTGPDVRRIVGGNCYNDVRTIGPEGQSDELGWGPVAAFDSTLAEPIYYAYFQGGPWNWLEDDNYFYCFGFEFAASTLNRLWNYQRVPKSSYDAVGNFYYFPSASFGNNNYQVPENNSTYPRCYESFAMSNSKEYIYWTVGSRATRFIHKSLKWPIDTYDSYEVDTSGGEVTGIWAFDPYVYVSTSGGSQGNQLIKYFDSDIMPSPTNLTATGALAKVNLSWTGTAIASYYNVYWDYAPGVTKETGNKLGPIYDTSTVHPNLTNPGPYYYVVTAVAPGDYESDESNEDSASPSFILTQGRVIW